jgi:hypothetical protein
MAMIILHSAALLGDEDSPEVNSVLQDWYSPGPIL